MREHSNDSVPNFLPLVYEKIKSLYQKGPSKIWAKAEVGQLIKSRLLINFVKVELLSNSLWQRTVSKERPGSTFTETLKKGILIPIGTSKESNFYAEIRYISFIKFSLTHQKLQSLTHRKNLPYFWKRGKHPLKVIES